MVLLKPCRKKTSSFLLMAVAGCPKHRNSRYQKHAEVLLVLKSFSGSLCQRQMHCHINTAFCPDNEINLFVFFHILKTKKKFFILSCYRIHIKLLKFIGICWSLEMIRKQLLVRNHCSAFLKIKIYCQTGKNIVVS